MEYPANMLGSTKSLDEKHSFENAEVFSTRIPTRTTSAASITRFISEKLLDWGVEERGAYCILFKVDSE